MSEASRPAGGSPDLPALVLLVAAGSDGLVCIDLDDVERVLPLAGVQEIPGAPDYLVGLMNLHGQTLPVIDLALRLGLDHVPPYGVDTLVVLCRSGDSRGALVVHAVQDVCEPEPAEVQMTETFACGRPLLRATVCTSAGLALLLDTRRLLAVDMTGLEALAEEQASRA